MFLFVDLYLTILLNILTYRFWHFSADKGSFYFLLHVISLSYWLGPQIEAITGIRMLFLKVMGIFITFHHFKCDVYCTFLIGALFLDAFEAGYDLVEIENIHTTDTYPYMHTYMHIHIHAYTYTFILIYTHIVKLN